MSPRDDDKAPLVEQELPTEQPQAEEPPPILGRWSRLYALVLGALALQVVLYYLLTSAYR